MIVSTALFVTLPGGYSEHSEYPNRIKGEAAFNSIACDDLYEKIELIGYDERNDQVILHSWTESSADPVCAVIEG